MNNNFKFELMETVVDEVTDYSGFVTARAEYVTGEKSYLVEAMDTTGNPTEFWCNENRLTVL